MSNRTVYGFDRLATALHRGNPGYSTGANGRPGGKTHLADKSTGRTHCGRPIDKMATTLVPERIADNPNRLRIHYAMCDQCMAGRPVAEGA